MEAGTSLSELDTPCKALLRAVGCCHLPCRPPGQVIAQDIRQEDIIGHFLSTGAAWMLAIPASIFIGSGARALPNLQPN